LDIIPSGLAKTLDFAHLADTKNLHGLDRGFVEYFSGKSASLF
uniref:Sulfurtransferase FdhD n=1 Tax=Haemonchus placei TaxID=6290 RepID=A0A0N4WJ25_HAEPC